MSAQRVQNHYSRAGTDIAARPIEVLHRTAGAEVAISPETLALFDHVHGRDVLATQELIARLEPKAGATGYPTSALSSPYPIPAAVALQERSALLSDWERRVAAPGIGSEL
jgi:hypothetical protein